MHDRLQVPALNETDVSVWDVPVDLVVTCAQQTVDNLSFLATD